MNSVKGLLCLDITGPRAGNMSCNFRWLDV